ncbi:MAG: efflux RND transporter permease subunit, partial [Spirochaetaceae bacterium]
MLLSLLLMLIVFGSTGFIRQNLFDADDFSIAFIDIQMPAGTPISRTDQLTAEFERKLLPLVGNGEVKAVNAYVGFSAGSSENVSDPTVGQIVLDLEDTKQGRTRSVAQILGDVEELTAGIAGAESVRYRRQQSGPPVDAPLSFRLFGNSFDQLQDAAAIVRKTLNDSDGVFDVRDNLQLSSPELKIVVDEYQAARFGLNRQTIGAFIRAAFDGVDAGTVFIDNEEISIRVRYDLPAQLSYERFAQLSITAPDGRRIP